MNSNRSCVWNLPEHVAWKGNTNGRLQQVFIILKTCIEDQFSRAWKCPQHYYNIAMILIPVKALAKTYLLMYSQSQNHNSIAWNLQLAKHFCCKVYLSIWCGRIRSQARKSAHAGSQTWIQRIPIDLVMSALRAHVVHHPWAASRTYILLLLQARLWKNVVHLHITSNWKLHVELPVLISYIRTNFRGKSRNQRLSYPMIGNSSKKASATKNLKWRIHRLLLFSGVRNSPFSDHKRIMCSRWISSDGVSIWLILSWTCPLASSDLCSSISAASWVRINTKDIKIWIQEEVLMYKKNACMFYPSRPA